MIAYTVAVRKALSEDFLAADHLFSLFHPGLPPGILRVLTLMKASHSSPDLSLPGFTTGQWDPFLFSVPLLWRYLFQPACSHSC